MVGWWWGCGPRAGRVMVVFVVVIVMVGNGAEVGMGKEELDDI